MHVTNRKFTKIIVHFSLSDDDDNDSSDLDMEGLNEELEDEEVEDEEGMHDQKSENMIDEK